MNDIKMKHKKIIALDLYRSIFVVVIWKKFALVVVVVVFLIIACTVIFSSGHYFFSSLVHDERCCIGPEFRSHLLSNTTFYQPNQKLSFDLFFPSFVINLNQCGHN